MFVLKLFGHYCVTCNIIKLLTVSSNYLQYHQTTYSIIKLLTISSNYLQYHQTTYNIIKLLTNLQYHQTTYILCGFQAFAEKSMRTVPFWAMRQRAIAVPYRIFGKTSWLSRNVGQQLPLHDAK